ncbi:MAG TPA: hypothetical protein VLG40_03100 [Candidatus Saccharimonas sp.]|nr:hypothetical protein [Candidatus Saccharimonas sp.]
MEQQKSPFSTHERPPAPESTERHWKFLDVFKKDEQQQPKPQAPEVQKSKSEAAPEQQSSERHRSLGKKIMAFLRGEQPEQTPQQMPTVEQARPPLPQPTPELAPQPVIIERAKSIGRNVLQLIKRVTGEVQEVEAEEHVGHPIDVQPLVEAEGDVRLAMHELLAPVLAVEIPKVVRGSVGHEHTPEAEQAAVPDHATHVKMEENAPETPGDPFENYDGDAAANLEVRSQSLAVAVAEVFAHAALERRETRTPRGLRLQKIGIFALGAATAVGFVHTWHRIREVKKEQRELHKEYKRFEAEVRQTQAVEAAKLHALEQSNVESMSRRERQKYVYEVSEFAHEQADEIREVAQAQHVRTPEVVTPIIPRLDNTPDQRQPVKIVHSAAPQPEHYETFQPPMPVVEQKFAPNPEHHIQAVAPEKTHEDSFALKSPEQFKKTKRIDGGNGSGGTFGTAIMAAGTKVASSLLGAAPKQRIADNPTPTTPKPAYTSPAQGWLFLCALAAGTIAVVLFIVGIL